MEEKLKKKLLYYALAACTTIFIVGVTGLFGWHDAQSILAPSKRFDFVMSLTVIQLVWIMFHNVFAFLNKKNPERSIQTIRVFKILVALPSLLVLGLSWYLQFWPGSYR